jgi:chorismate-pyruvate lyase
MPRRAIQTQTKLDQPIGKNVQRQNSETRPELQTSRKKRSWTPQEKTATRRCQNRSNDLKKKKKKKMMMM